MLGVRQNKPLTPCPIPGCNCNGGVPVAMTDEDLKKRYPTMFSTAREDSPGVVGMGAEFDAVDPLVEENHLAVVRHQANQMLNGARQSLAMVTEIDRLREVCHQHWLEAEHAKVGKAETMNALKSQIDLNDGMRKERNAALEQLIVEQNKAAVKAVELAASKKRKKK